MLTLPLSRLLAIPLLFPFCGAYFPSANLQAAAPKASPSAAASHESKFNPAKAKFEILLSAGLYTRWPAGAFEEGPHVFRVGIVGSDPQGGQLDELASGRKLAGRHVVIHHFPSPKEVKYCQILFLTSSLSQSDRLGLIEKYKSAPVLLAGETPGFCLEGGGIHLQLENGSVKFALNPQVLSSQKLTIDPRFSRLARSANFTAEKKSPATAISVHPDRNPRPTHSGPDSKSNSNSQLPPMRPRGGTVHSLVPRKSPQLPGGGKHP